MGRTAKEIETLTAPQPPASPLQALIEKKFGASSFTGEDLQAFTNGLVDTSKTLTDEEWKKVKGRLSWPQQREIMGLELQPYINQPPQPKESLMDRACAADGDTITSWGKQWLDQTLENCRNYDVMSHSAMLVHGAQAGKPVIVAGSGPSLKRNIEVLAEKRGGICLVSALHNFAFLEDNSAPADYYITLDAGEITIPEVHEGGKKDPEHYWALTKGRTLIAALVTHPGLLEKWQGRILFYHTPVPDPDYLEKVKAVTPFNLFYNVGGNVLGAALYHAKAVLGAGVVVFIGADFAFGPDKKFHSWDSPYDDKFSGLMTATDIFGNRAYTWPSYYGFKCWFDYQCCGGAGNAPGLYINATEGGIFGAYPEGNIRQVQQMTLKDALNCFTMHTILPDMLADPARAKLLF